MSWDRRFADPIELPGKNLITLRDAALYIKKLPKVEQDLEEWQAAIACLIGTAEGRDFVMHSRIGLLRALTVTSNARLLIVKKRTGGAGVSSGTKNDSPHLRQ